jgi:hydrogenase maturation protein HypF|tara:strand:- start:10567 stop:12837 length:2271 start_codon:yes stop_codon:yes gene_type:complete
VRNLVSKTFKIQIKGRVQGVGFRPFVFNLAKEHQLNGSVSNNEEGVIIYCNTSEEKATQFLEQILLNKPEIAVITAHSTDEVPLIKFDDFSIVITKTSAQINLPLTPDFAICENCKAEISDSGNRRYNYAFTTCVHCGPRYAITQKFPFERAHTSLTEFDMCSTCLEEYTNPTNRRFHSQTNSCKSCGIQLQLVTNLGETIAINQLECIEKSAKRLIEGNILAIKNTNGYVLCCDASNPEAIKKLRKRKKRPNKPFAVLYPSMESIKKDFNVSNYEANALKSRVAPIVILQNTKHTRISVDTIAPKFRQTGVMLPSSALLELIIKKLGIPIVATSGNIHGSPIISNDNDAHKQLNEVADYFLHHNLDIQFPQDDSVVTFAESSQLILRRSRGLAPNYINTTINSKKPILAMGGHLKSTFTFVPNAQTYVSQYFGNLDNYEVLKRYQATIEDYVALFETKPKTILIDKHTQYQSSILGKELALEWNADIQEIQHHKAHFASVLGENNLFASEEKILGIVWDGTGLGDDNHIWGGEFFTYQGNKIERLTHFEYYDWLANDKMAKEPRLALFSLLDSEHRSFIKDKFSETEWNIYSSMIKTNTLKTSSVGRLFDAVASALDLVDLNTFEAEAAMQLETCAKSYSKSYYIDFLYKKNYGKIPSNHIVQSIVKAYNEGFCKERLAYSFIYTLAKCILNVAKTNEIKTVACSGGVFQNSLLVFMLNQMTKKENINLKLNCKLSANDENISFGQLMYHQHIKN